MHLADGQVDTAREHFNRALEIGRRLRDRLSSAFALIGLSKVALGAESFVESQRLAREVLELADQLDHNELR